MALNSSRSLLQQILFLLALGLLSGCKRKAQTSSTPGTDAGPIAQGAALYKQYCALCHGDKAQGYVADNAPSLANTTFLASVSDSFLLRSIELGRPGTPMAGYSRGVGGPLDPAQIAAIAQYLRSLNPTEKVALVDKPLTGDPARGEVWFHDNCSKCHGDKEKRVNAVHLANPTFLLLAEDAFLRYAVENGRPGTPMESFTHKIQPGQLEDILATLAQWRKDKPAVIPAPPPPKIEVPPVVLNPSGEHPTFTLREERFVSADQVKAALDSKKRIVILDARASSDWARGHIPGATPMPYYAMEGVSLIPNDGTWIVAYCACPHHASGMLVDELIKRGYKHAVVLDEGILVWQQRGLGIETAPGATPAPMPLPAPPPPQ